jgi:hypothetical protein
MARGPGSRIGRQSDATSAEDVGPGGYSSLILPGGLPASRCRIEVGAFYWTVPAPDIVNSGREEQDSVSA